MGVDLTVSLEKRDRGINGDYWTPVCEVFCGRYYHWQQFIEDNQRYDRDDRIPGASRNEPTYIPFKTLRANRDTIIFWSDDPDHEPGIMLKDTDVYLITKAIVKKCGKKNVRWTWRIC